MTALKPCEELRVHGVASRRYPLNEKCAHPECSEPVADPHHIFPRSLIGNDCWFVVFGDKTETSEKKGGGHRDALPHVAGLCRAHHDEVEQHRAWIKLENGIFVWYVRLKTPNDTLSEDEIAEGWEIGPTGGAWRALDALNPQPGSREGKPKRKRFKGEQRRKRRTISIRVPDDTEDGGAIYDETLEEVKAKLVLLGLYDPDEKIPAYEATIAAWRDWVDTP